jgi:RNA polymerase sigma factor (sigma-70 family)
MRTEQTAIGGDRSEEGVSRGERSREAFFALIGRDLHGLYRYARHLIAYYKALGDLVSDELTPEDAVDEVILRAYREFTREPSRGAWRRRLMELTRAHVESEAAKRSKMRERAVAKEEKVPQTPPEEWVYTLGEEIMYFFEPEEELKVEDVVPNLKVPTPEEAVEALEVRLCVDAALGGLPRKWRRALQLRYINGLQEDAVARALGESPEETNRILEQARRHLRERLLESQCAAALPELNSRPN